MMISDDMPSFSTINLQQFTTHLDTLLKSHLQQIKALLQQKTVFTWDTLMLPLDQMDNALERLWSPLSHLHAVSDSKALRTCYQACLPILSAYESAVGQNSALYHALQSLDRTVLNATQCKILDDSLLDFKLSGVALSSENKSRFEVISAQLSTLSNQFENNILDAVGEFSHHVLDEVQLRGVPDHVIASARAFAAEKGLSGWLLTIDYPTYHGVVTYADDRKLRQIMHEAFATRASDIGPSAGKFDNTLIMRDILALRHESATLLDFPHYAALSLASKMAESTDEVNEFLIDLTTRARLQAEQEAHALKDYAKRVCHLDALAPFDIAYVSEKKRQAEYDLSEETLRPYFPVQHVMEGLFKIIQVLYGMTVTEVTGIDVWHPDVRCYCVRDELDAVRGYVYVDLFARADKRGGAWMNSLQSRMRLVDGSIQCPIATLTCNFAKPVGDKPFFF